jgi:hypothetical protein
VSTIFAIEKGEYSDYRVVGIYSTKEVAEKVCDAINVNEDWGKATVSEWPLDPAVDALNAGHSMHRVLMRRDGTVEECRRQDITSYEVAGECHIWRRSTAPAYRGKGVPDVLQATVWAEDTQHAIKIVNERRGQMIAMGEWEDAS